MALLRELGAWGILNSVYRTGSALADSKRRQIFWKKNRTVKFAVRLSAKEIAYLRPNRASPGWADRLPR
jgi:hypothetical protein